MFVVTFTAGKMAGWSPNGLVLYLRASSCSAVPLNRYFLRVPLVCLDLLKSFGRLWLPEGGEGVFDSHFDTKL